MNAEESNFLGRIAEALERQVEQHEEAVARNLKLRDDNIARHERERDAELAEAREVNRQLVEKITAAVKQQAAILALLESAKSVDAVRSQRRDPGTLTTRDERF